MTNEIVKQDAQEVQTVSVYEAFREQCAEACINAMLDAARKGKPENIIRLSGFVAVRDMPLPEVKNDAEALRKENEQLRDALEKCSDLAVGGLCQMSHGGTRAFCEDIKLHVADILKGGAA